MPRTEPWGNQTFMRSRVGRGTTSKENMMEQPRDRRKIRRVLCCRNQEESFQRGESGQPVWMLILRWEAHTRVCWKLSSPISLKNNNFALHIFLTCYSFSLHSFMVKILTSHKESVSYSPLSLFISLDLGFLTNLKKFTNSCHLVKFSFTSLSSSYLIYH